jgi:hypothetical protein
MARIAMPDKITLSSIADKSATMKKLALKKHNHKTTKTKSKDWG